MSALKISLAFGLLTSCTLWAQSSDYWSGLAPSIAVQARGGTGVTNPIILELPKWARMNAADSSFISQNPALLATLNSFSSKNAPFTIETSVAGSLLSSKEALSPTYVDIPSIRADMPSEPGETQMAGISFGSDWIKKDVATSFHYSNSRSFRINEDNSFSHFRHRDYSWQLGVGGPVFERADLGRIDMGMGVKAIFRTGDEIDLSADEYAASTLTLVDAGMGNFGLGAGVDYGILYALPSAITGAWMIQAGFIWKDLGTTQFMGDSTSNGRRFLAIPNNQVIGLGLGTPNILGGVRSAIRLEYKEWYRSVSFWEKIALGLELRSPLVANLQMGISGKRISSGIAFRFPSVEIQLAQVRTLVGQGNSKHTLSSLVMELKGVF